MRLIAFGDSFINGTGDETGLGWIGRLANLQKAKDRDFTLYNLGVRGDSSADIAARWSEELTARTKPGLSLRLVFSFGVNDCCDLDQSYAPRIAPEHAVDNARNIFEAAKKIAPVLWVGPPPIDDKRINRRIEELNAELAKLAKTLSLPYLEVFRTLSDDPVWMGDVGAWDGAHPGAKGYERFAAHVGASPYWSQLFL